MLELRVDRRPRVGAGARAIPGDLYLGPAGRLAWQCRTLESADYVFPPGRYRVILAHSRKFDRVLPRFTGIPGRSAILFHAGNTLADTEGCIIVGRRIVDTRRASTGAIEALRWPELRDSRPALDAFVGVLFKHRGPWWCEVREVDGTRSTGGDV